jgi:hypothetical protein
LDTRKVTRQYRLSKWAEIIRECRSSGHTISAWCAENNVNIKSYYYWLKRVRTVACESLPVMSDNTQPIIPVKISSSLATASSTAQKTSSHIILRIGAVTLELNNGASAELIANTIRALHVR